MILLAVYGFAAGLCLALFTYLQWAARWWWVVVVPLVLFAATGTGVVWAGLSDNPGFALLRLATGVLLLLACCAILSGVVTLATRRWVPMRAMSSLVFASGPLLLPAGLFARA